ncbi:MAG TPA: RsmB/NOP family class I SAM-dependent RNA methyltransferase [Casimicrobiaceae bacterium]|nr:RsmB/NOP family class I SAM-dependent RNA methyltransferase [Casimicrobiaceae bacterium]
MNGPRPHANQLAGLAAALERVNKLDAPSDSVLSAFFREHREMGARDRAFVAEGAFAYLRRKRSLETLAQTTSPRELALAVAVRELGYSVRDLEPALNTAEEIWLSAFKSRMRTPLPAAIAADVPDWLWERLGTFCSPEERDALARAWQHAAPFDLRVNPLRISRGDALAMLADDGFEVAATPYSPIGIRVSGRPSLIGHPLLADGRVEVQDEGSQLIGYLVAPRRNDMVVDFCAGAGGKTLLLGALMRSQGRLYAFDVVATRFARFAPRLKRSGLSNVHPQLLAHERDTKVKRLAGKIDRVLVDAPCTGFGTLRRNPDLKWRQTPEGVRELTAKQRDILAAAATLVKKGGRLVYATCSVLPEENDQIVGAFLAAHPDFHEVDASAELHRAGIALNTGSALRLSTPIHHCDGFYGAVMERA